MAADETKRRYSLFSKSLKSVVEPVVRPVLKTQGTAASKLMTEWENIVGRDMAQHCFPLKINFPKDRNMDGTLVVACVGAHALALQHLQPVIIERIASYFGYKAVSRMTIEQRSAAPQPKNRKSIRKAAKVLDSSCVETVADPDLKDALSGLAKTLTGHTMPAQKTTTE